MPFKERIVRIKDCLHVASFTCIANTELCLTMLIFYEQCNRCFKQQTTIFLIQTCFTQRNPRPSSVLLWLEHMLTFLRELTWMTMISGKLTFQTSSTQGLAQYHMQCRKASMPTRCYQSLY